MLNISIEQELDIINQLSRIGGIQFSDEQKKVLLHHGGMCILACAGSGKALKNGTGVLTPSGYVAIEKLKIGDKVYDEQGHIQVVTGVFPQGKKELMLVELKNGVIIPCSSDHLWSCTLNPKKGGKYKVLKTKQMYDIFHGRGADGTIHEKGIGLPLPKAVEFDKFNKESYPIDPYLLGIIIFNKYAFNCESEWGINGSGFGTYIEIKDNDKELYNNINNILSQFNISLSDYSNSGKAKYEIRYRSREDWKNFVELLHNERILDSIGWNNETIPDKYLYSPIEIRKRLLAGVLDSSSSIKDNKYKIELGFNTNLANQLMFVMETLGYIDIKHKTFKTGSNKNRVELSLRYNSEIPHTLKSIDDLLNKNKFIKSNTNEIYNIMHSIEKPEMTCIKVTGESELFLTEHCTVTHNTSIVTNLIAKRLLTHEIPNIETLLCTTYSKGGADEMGLRLNKLLKKLGIYGSVEVKTMHAIYLSVLREFGYPSTVIDIRDKSRYLRESCKDAEVSLEEDEFQELDSLLSYQINNLLSDKDLVGSYAYTLNNVSLEQYSKIRQGYNNRKIQNHVIDFDDMQLYMYSLLYVQNRQDVLQYCRSKWTDIYVDEAQDISKIQYAILKKLIVSNDRFVVIGDDDQCLIDNTTVHTINGVMNISQIQPGDMVLSGVGEGEVSYQKVASISRKFYEGDTIRIFLDNGYIIEGTPEHKIFSLCINDYEESNHVDKGSPMSIFKNFIDQAEEMRGEHLADYCAISNVFFEKHKDKDIHKHRLEIDGLAEDDIKYTKEEFSNIDSMQERAKKLQLKFSLIGKECELETHWCFNRNSYNETELRDVEIGSHIPVLMNGVIKDTTVRSKQVNHYKGKVYDISVPTTRNFIANGVVVHNCIYQWRGADPSIILNICADHDIARFVLSTNYRCAGNIVKQASKGIVHNIRRSDKEMKPYKEGGEIKVCDCGCTNLYEMSKYAYKYIKELVIDKGVIPSKIAILSRNNNHLSILSSLLFKDGIHCETSKEMKITKLVFYNSIKGILEMSRDTRNSLITENNLFKVCTYLSKANSKKFGAIQKTTGMSLSELLGYICKENLGVSDATYTTGIKIPNSAKAKIQEFIYSLKDETIQSLISIYRLISDSDMVKRATGLLIYYLSASDYTYKKNMDKKRTVEGLVAYVIDLVKTMGFNETMQFLRVSEQYEEGKMAIPGPKVCMATMHGSKGKEWDYVVLFADDNVTFPSFSNINMKLNQGLPVSDVFYEIDENRRLHYVAMTRAKKELAVFTDKSNVGVYLLEALDIFDTQTNNKDIIDMAKVNQVLPELLEMAEQKIFNPSSKYYYTIDISDMCANIEIEYLYKVQEAPKNTISLNDIQTGSPENLVD